MNSFGELYRRVGATGNERQRQGSAEELYDFSSSHFNPSLGANPT